jgi:hypothetical protein
MSENQDFIPADEAVNPLQNMVVAFSINDAAIAEVKEDLGEVDAYKDLEHAKAAKKTLTKMRTTLADAHKETKADALAFGKRCDLEKNRLLNLIGEIENPITDQLNEIKNAAELREQERQQAIMERIEQVQAFALDRHDLTLDELTERLDTLLKHKIDPELFEEHTEDAENAKEVSESKLRIAIHNEETRLEEVKRQEATEAENKELRERLAKSEAEQADRDAAQKVIDDAAAAEQKEKDDLRQKELDEQAETQRKAQKKIDDDAAEKAAEEAAEKARKIAAIQAPDVEKLELYAADIKTLINNKPTMQVEETNEIMLSAVASLIEVARYIETKAGELK